MSVDPEGTAVQLNRLAEKLQFRGRVLAIGDSAREHAVLNIPYFREHSDQVDCLAINLDRTALGSYRHFKVVEGNGNHMPEFADETFDVVLAVMLFEHDRYFWKTLSEIRRVLKKGGVFVSANLAFTTSRLPQPPESTSVYMHHTAPGVRDYYRFSQQAVEEVMYEGYERVVSHIYQDPPRILTYGFRG